MTTEIVKFESATGIPVQFTAEEVKRQLCPNISDQELAYVMGLCQAQKLNPFVKDVYIVKYDAKSPASIITSKDVFFKRANANPKYEGFEAGVTVLNKKGEIVQRQGEAVYKAAGETLIGGWCRVYVKGRKPVYAEVSLDEYSTGKSSWNKMPGTMICKVAKVHAMREAFPDDFQGLYIAEEMGDSGERVIAVDEVPNTDGEIVGITNKGNVVDVIEFEEVPSDEEIDELLADISKFASLCDKSVNEVVDALRSSTALKGLGFPSNPSEMTFEQYERASNQVRVWIERAEAMREEMEQYEEEDIPF